MPAPLPRAQHEVGRGADPQRPVELGQGPRQALVGNVEVARSRPPGGEGAATEGQRLEVALHRPRVGCLLPCEAHHGEGGVERHRGARQVREVQPGAAPEVGGDAVLGDRGGEVARLVEETRAAAVAPLLGPLLVHRNRVAFHLRIMTACTGTSGSSTTSPVAFAALVAREAPGSVALSGGGTARRAYERLADVDLAWDRHRRVLRRRALGAGRRPGLERGHGALRAPRPRAPGRGPLAAGRGPHARRRRGRLRRADRRRAPDRPGAPRARARRSHRVAVPGHRRAGRRRPARDPERRRSPSPPAPHVHVSRARAGRGSWCSLWRARGSATRSPACAAGADLPAGRVAAERVVWLVDAAAVG